MWQPQLNGDRYVSDKPISVNLPNGGVLELFLDSKGQEHVQLIARKRRGRWREWTEITPRLRLIEDCVLQNDYAIPVLANQIKKASRYKYFNSPELSRFAWKLSRLGFKETARRLSWTLKEPLNGYPIIPETPVINIFFLLKLLISFRVNFSISIVFRLLMSLFDEFIYFLYYIFFVKF